MPRRYYLSTFGAAIRPRTPLDDLEDAAADGLLAWWEWPVLWFRRRPLLWAFLGAAVVLVVAL